MNNLLYTVKYYFYHLIYKHVRYLFIVLYKRKYLAEKRAIREYKEYSEMLNRRFYNDVQPPESEPVFERDHLVYGKRSNNSIWDTNDPRFKKADRILNERLKNIDTIINNRIKGIDKRMNDMLRRFE